MKIFAALAILSAIARIISVSLGSHQDKFDGIFWPSILIAWVIVAVIGWRDYQ